MNTVKFQIGFNFQLWPVIVPCFTIYAGGSDFGQPPNSNFLQNITLYWIRA
jgi:hypothetical protein